MRKPFYTSFLVRLWAESDADRDWVAQVELIPSGDRRSFASLDELLAFIRAQLGERAPASQPSTQHEVTRP